MGKLICSNCGAEVVIPEHSKRISGITFSEDSIGTHYLETKENTKMGKAAERMVKMAANGMDVSKYFVATAPNGDEKLMKWGESGVPELVPEDDTEKAIMDYGYTDNKNLFKRWVMAQYFRMDRNGEYYQELKKRGYDYQWKVLNEMMQRLAKLEDRDPKAFNEEVQYYNKNVVLDCINHYRDNLIEYFKSMTKLKCKGIEYVNAGYKYGTHGRCLFVADIDKVVNQKINKHINKILHSENYRDITRYLGRFMDERLISFPFYMREKMCKAFINAYTGYGAYFTLQNMIRFHGIHLTDYISGAVYDTARSSENYLTTVAAKYAMNNENWRLLALLRKTAGDLNW